MKRLNYHARTTPSHKRSSLFFNLCNCHNIFTCCKEIHSYIAGIFSPTARPHGGHFEATGNLAVKRSLKISAKKVSVQTNLCRQRAAVHSYPRMLTDHRRHMKSTNVLCNEALNNWYLWKPVNLPRIASSFSGNKISNCFPQDQSFSVLYCKRIKC